MFKIRARRWTGLALGPGTPMVTQRAPWGGKSSTCEGAPQVVVWMSVTAGKIRAGELENSLDPSRRRSLRQQVAGDPQIDDVPIGLRKAALRSSSAAYSHGRWRWPARQRGRERKHGP